MMYLKLALLLLTVSINAQSDSIKQSKNQNGKHCKTPVIHFDDSPGSDGTVALFTLLKSPKIDLLATYSTGNVYGEAGAGAKYTYNILDWLGSFHTQVFVGSFFSLLDETLQPAGGTSFVSTTRPSVPVGDGGILYSTTLWGTYQLLPQSARHYVAKVTVDGTTQDEAVSINGIRDIISKSPQKVTFLSTGSMTGPWKILMGDSFSGIGKAPDAIFEKIEKVVIMGGAFDVDGNISFTVPFNTKAETNMYADPLAAKGFFELMEYYHIPVEIFPLDVTNTVPLTKDFLAKLKAEAKTPEAHYVSVLLDELARTWFAPDTLEGLFIWDVVATLGFIYPKLICKAQPGQSVTVVDSPASAELTTENDQATFTISYPTNFGQTKRKQIGAGNVTIVQGVKSTILDKLIKVLNSPCNTARCPLKEPVGCYKYTERA